MSTLLDKARIGSQCKCEELREQLTATRKKSGRRKRELKRLNRAVEDRNMWQRAAHNLQSQVFKLEKKLKAAENPVKVREERHA